VTTTVSRNDDIMATGSLPAALSLPAAISGGCARLTPPCATALLDLRCTLGALVAPRLRHRLVLLLLLLNRPPCATRLAGALRPLAVRALYACERVDLGTNGCVLEGGIGRDEGATRTVRTLSSSIYLGSKKWTGNGQIHSHSLPRVRACIGMVRSPKANFSIPHVSRMYPTCKIHISCIYPIYPDVSDMYPKMYLGLVWDTCKIHAKNQDTCILLECNRAFKIHLRYSLPPPIRKHHNKKLRQAKVPWGSKKTAHG